MFTGLNQRNAIASNVFEIIAEAIVRYRRLNSRKLRSSRLLYPPLAALGEDGLEVAFEEGAGVLEVLFGVGFGGGDALKRFVEDADDPLLFGERRDGNVISFRLSR